MREIKFRGYNEAQGWVYGNLLMSEVDVQGNSVCEIHTPFADSMSVSRCFVDPKSVGQFVGLRDKNGKEIYEGDIIESKEGVFTIENWGDGVYRVVSDGLTWEWLHQLKAKGYLEPGKGNYEVIGNIFTTPELLTK